MKIIRTYPATEKRKRRITVELLEGEQLVSINPDMYYRLGGQLNDVVGGYVIEQASQVYWNSISQMWEEE